MVVVLVIAAVALVGSGDKESSSVNLDSVLKTAEPASDDLWLEKVVDTYAAKSTGVLTDKQVESLSVLGVNANKFNTIEVVEDSAAGITYKKFKVDDHNYVALNEKDQIMTISRYIEDNLEAECKTTKEDYFAMAEKVKQQLGLSDDYKLEYVRAEDANLCDARYVRILENGLENPYEAVNILLYRGDGSIGFIHRFDESVNTLKAEISEEEALKSAQEQIEKLEGKVDGVELVYYKPNFFWEEESYETSKFVRLSYRISLNEGFYFIYVDAVTGEVTGGDMAADSAGCFGSSIFYNNNGPVCANRAANKFILRGYSPVLMSTISGSPYIDKIKAFVKLQNRPDAYGFYYIGHGSYNNIGDVKNSNGDFALMYSSEVTGNWKFVVLDSCSSAADATWSNAFKIYSTSINKAFVGWSSRVAVGTLKEFNEEFWPLVGGCSIQWAMKTGWDRTGYRYFTAYPRFTGDASYYGNV
ncbi:MAG: PepSY domain-containing protein [Bacillota bacterium]|jgi:hypothetical protein